MDDSVFHRLYEAYHQDVFNFLTYLTGDRLLSEDLMHEVYIRVLKAYAGFEGKSSEKTWLFSIAKNVAIDYFRKKSVRQKHLYDKFDWEKSELVSPDVQPDEIAEMNDDMKQMLQVLNTCTGDQKMVIVLRYFQELSIAETAETLSWSEGKVKTTQHRAIKALQKKLKALSAEGGS